MAGETAFGERAEKIRNAVDGRLAATGVLLDVGDLAVRLEFERGVRRLEKLRFVADRERGAAVVFEGGALAEFLGVVEQCEPRGEHVGHEDAVVVEAGALRGVLVDAHFEPAGVAVERAVGAGVDDAGGAAEAEEDGVGPAHNFDAAGVVAVPRGFGLEIIDGVVGGGEAADAGVGVGAETEVFVLLALRIGIEKGAVDAADIGADSEGEERLVVEGGEVLQELLGINGDGGADIDQLGADARAAKGIGGDVTLAVRGVHLERGERDDGGIDRRPGRRGRLRTGG